MKIFWSWQSDTPKETGHYLIRDALKDAIKKLRRDDEIEEAVRENIHLDHDTKDVPYAPRLMDAILEKIRASEVVAADVTIVGKVTVGTPEAEDKCLINSNVALELGYALHACCERVILVFNGHYGTNEDLPFDLRHRAGAIVFKLAPDADEQAIDAQRKNLTDAFLRLLKLCAKDPQKKDPLSVRPVIETQLQRTSPLPKGGSDDVFQLRLSVENDGEEEATDFTLQVDVPAEIIDETPPLGLSRPGPPGFNRFEITHETTRITHLYPGRTSSPLISFNVALRDHTKRQPELMKKALTVTFYSGSMKGKAESLTLADLATSVPNGRKKKPG
jgi:hypothetical protein